MDAKPKKRVNNDYVQRTSARVLEDKLVQHVRDQGRKNVGQRCDCGVSTPPGFCPPDGNRNQTPAQITGGICSH